MTNDRKESYRCRVCGLYLSYQPWGEDGNDPTYEICPCCGVEFGYEDYSKSSIQEYRKQWIDNGCKWFILSKKPTNWSFKIQSSQISDKYR